MMISGGMDDDICLDERVRVDYYLVDSGLDNYINRFVIYGWREWLTEYNSNIIIIAVNGDYDGDWDNE